MKLKSTTLSRYFYIITIPTGWAAIIISIFIQPVLLPSLDLLRSSAQGSFRVVGVVGFLGLAFLAVIALTLIGLEETFRSRRFSSAISPVSEFLSKQPVKRYWLSFLLLLSLLFLQLSLRGKVNNELDDLFFSLIRPILIWGFLVFSTSFLRSFLPTEEGQTEIPDYWKMTGWLFLFFFGAGVIIQLLGYGYGETSRIAGNFDLTGYPLLGYQVLIAAVPALLIPAIIDRLPAATGDNLQSRKWMIDIFICMALFVTAAVLWKAFPIQTHMFYDQPRPPNYQYYPNSDSNVYDRTALSLLTAGKFQSYTYRFDENVGRRPYLALYLAALHKTTNSNYLEMIAIQQIILSAIPVMVYLLTSTLHSRSSGILAALLIIIRERNGLALSDNVTGVHTQLLMSEIPTMFLLILFLSLLSKAVLAGSRKNLWFLASGGVLGVAMLIRQEVIALIPFIILGIYLTNRDNLKVPIRQAGWMMAAILLVISPWIFRNWQATGQFYLDVPGNKLYSIYKTIGVDPDWLKDLFQSNQESNFINNGRILSQDTGPVQNQLPTAKIGLIQPGSSSLLTESSENPGRLDNVLNHMTNQLIQSVVYLPSYPLTTDIDYLSKLMIGKLDRYYGGVFYSPQSYTKELPYWWSDWNGSIPTKSLLPVACVVFLISLGFSSAWKKEKLTAVLPLFSFFGYISVYSLVRASGGRFLQEMDWVTSIYYSIGLVAILNGVFFGSSISQNWNQLPGYLHDTQQNLARRLSRTSILLMLVLLLCVGAVPVVVERLIPTSYPDTSAEALRVEILESSDALLDSHEKEVLLTFLDGNGEAVFGKAYYPRYFEAGENLVDIRPEVLGNYEGRYLSGHTEFYLIGSNTLWTILKRLEVAEELPNSSEVFAIGCNQDGVLDAVAVIVLDSGTASRVYWRDMLETTPLSCPLLPPKYNANGS